MLLLMSAVGLLMGVGAGLFMAALLDNYLAISLASKIRHSAFVGS
jgi:hypothetical protein